MTSRPSAGQSGSAPVAEEPPSLAARLTSLERVMGVVDSRVDDHYLRSAREVTRQITERLSLSPAHTVVALAGATGSGKSSIYNALTGLDLSEVGVRRPVTNAPHACVWGPDGAGPLLDWLSIPYDNRTGRESALDADTQAELRGLVLLDLPDHDSTQLAHRLEVDRLVEMVDLLVWVLDPQKYADEAVHARYLRRLSRHAGVTVVVLNQIDMLSSADAEACLGDVRRLVDADGLRGVPLVPLSALRGDGMPDLKDRITATVASRQASVQRLAADLDIVADELAPLVGPEVRETVDRGSAKRLYTTLADAAGAAAVGEAVERGYKFTASRTLGWPLIHWFGRAKADPSAALRENVGTASRPQGRGRTTARPAVLHPVQRPAVEESLRHLSDEAANALPAPWPRLVHRAARSEVDQLPDALDRAVATADLGLARRPLWWWGYRIVQYLMVLALLGGTAWMLGLGIAAAVGGADSALEVGDLVLPLMLLFGGLVLGPVLHVIGMIAARRGARLARLRAEQAVLDAVTTVARERVLVPVRAELSAYAHVRDALIEFGIPARGYAVVRGAEPSSSTGSPGIGAVPPSVAPQDALDGLGPLPSASNYPDPFQRSPTSLSPSTPPSTTPGAAQPETGHPMTHSTPPGAADRPDPDGGPNLSGEAADRPESGRLGSAHRASGQPDSRHTPGRADAAQPSPWRPEPPRADANPFGAPQRSTGNFGASRPSAGQAGAAQNNAAQNSAAKNSAGQNSAARTDTRQSPSPTEAWRPEAPQAGAGWAGSVPPPPRPDAVRRGAIPPAPATPPAPPGVRPFLGAKTPPPPTAPPGLGAPHPPPPSSPDPRGPLPRTSANEGEPQARPPLARRAGPKLPPAPPPRPEVEPDPEAVWARTRPAARPTSRAADAPSAAPAGSTGRDSRPGASRLGAQRPGPQRSDAVGADGKGDDPAAASSASREAPADDQSGQQRKGLRGLFNRRKESADVVDRWWATTDDGGDDPFGRPPASDPTDGSRPRVPGQR